MRYEKTIAEQPLPLTPGIVRTISALSARLGIGWFVALPVTYSWGH